MSYEGMIKKMPKQYVMRRYDDYLQDWETTGISVMEQQRTYEYSPYAEFHNDENSGGNGLFMDSSEKDRKIWLDNFKVLLYDEEGQHYAKTIIEADYKNGNMLQFYNMTSPHAINKIFNDAIQAAMIWCNEHKETSFVGSDETKRTKRLCRHDKMTYVEITPYGYRSVLGIHTSDRKDAYTDYKGFLGNYMGHLFCKKNILYEFRYAFILKLAIKLGMYNTMLPEFKRDIFYLANLRCMPICFNMYLGDDEVFDDDASARKHEYRKLMRKFNCKWNRFKTLPCFPYNFNTNKTSMWHIDYEVRDNHQVRRYFTDGVFDVIQNPMPIINPRTTRWTAPAPVVIQVNPPVQQVNSTKDDCMDIMSIIEDYKEQMKSEDYKQMLDKLMNIYKK